MDDARADAVIDEAGVFVTVVARGVLCDGLPIATINPLADKAIEEPDLSLNRQTLLPYAYR